MQLKPPAFRRYTASGATRSRDIFFTISAEEKDSIIANDPSWEYEGIAYYGAPYGGALTADDIANGSITAAKMSTNSCSSGQLLKVSGTSWACADDENTGSSIGNEVDSDEITDGVIVNADISGSAAIDYSKLNLGTNISSANITNGTITNDDISGSAGIAYSKLNLASSITSGNIADGAIANADVSDTAAIAYSKLNLGTNVSSTNITNGTIVNDDINASAAISSSKINFDADVNVGGTGAFIAGSSILDRAYLDKDHLAIANTDELDLAAIELYQTCPNSSGYCPQAQTSMIMSAPAVRFSDTGGAVTMLGVSGEVSGLIVEDGAGVLSNIMAKNIIAGDDGYLYTDSVLQFKKLTADPETCDALAEGKMYYNSTAKRIKVCDGTTWQTVEWDPTP